MTPFTQYALQSSTGRDPQHSVSSVATDGDGMEMDMSIDNMEDEDERMMRTGH